MVALTAQKLLVGIAMGRFQPPKLTFEDCGPILKYGNYKGIRVA